MDARWAAVEIMGHRQHVGRISEETFAGATLLRIEALQRDGSFEVIRYGGASIFSMRDITEEAARKAVAGPRGWACSSFNDGPCALAGVCATCGHAREEHEPPRALPEHEDGDDA